MKQTFFLSTFVLSVVLVGCSAAPPSAEKPKDTPVAKTTEAPQEAHNHAEGEAHDHEKADSHAGHDHAATSKFGLEVINASKGFKAGTPFDLRVAVRNNETGDIQKAFDTVHEKKLHLIVVSEGLTSFQHVHPTMDADGFWSQRLTLPRGGRFLLFADGGVSGAKFNARTELTAEGNPAPRPSFALSAKSEVDGVTAQVVEGAKLPLSDHAHVTVKLSSPTGWETYLGEPGHLLMIRQDGKEFLHAHPKGAMKDGRVVFDAHFHDKGVYRAWAQFQRGSKVMTFPFTLEVGDAQ